MNWCESCQTVLANEQVVNGACERCKNPVVQKELEQWFFKVTQYAEELLSCLDTLDWPEPIKLAQKNWIGRSEGALIEFKLQATSYKLQAFTTRPDTLFGATYMVLAPEHALVAQLKEQIKNWKEVDAYRASARKKTELERAHLEKEKSGVPLEGVTAINPANNQEIPVWIADYVLASYGTGAIMAVPAHDERDFAFAKKFSLPIRMVVCPHYPAPTCPVLDEAYEGGGHMVESGEFNGLPNEEAKWAITKKVKGERVTQYRIRDWLISRQRYWGAPIPIIYCDTCGTVPVPSADLPVLLPTDVDFKPTGESPLRRSKSFHKISCPTCGKPARRESDTMDTFVCSSWYYLRYPNATEIAEPFTKESLAYWLPVDMYVGGAEHAVLHLLYARFITKALRDLGYLSFDEPFARLRNQGMILGEDGEKMSKSRGNVINPDDVIASHGADTLRLYEMFMGPFEATKPWSTGSIIGIRRFLDKAWKLYERLEVRGERLEVKKPILEKLLHKTIKKVTHDIETFNFNTAISALMILLNELGKTAQKHEGLSQKTRDAFLLLLAPFAPHLAEELWERDGHSTLIARASWPTWDETLVKDEIVRVIVQVNGKPRDAFDAPADTDDKALQKEALAREKVQKWIGGRQPKKIVVVRGRLVNIVV